MKYYVAYAVFGAFIAMIVALIWSAIKAWRSPPRNRLLAHYESDLMMGQDMCDKIKEGTVVGLLVLIAFVAMLVL